MSEQVTPFRETSKEFEALVINRSRLLCAWLWEDSPNKIQQKYALHGIGQSVTLKEFIEYRKRGSEDALPFPTLLVIIGKIADFESLTTHKMTKKSLGQALVKASFASCMYGGRACIGDIEEYIRILEETHDFSGVSMPPADMLLAFNVGQPLYLRVFLNDMLQQASDNLKHILSTKPYLANELWESEKGTWCIKTDVMSTNFHLLRSLVTCIEPQCGHT